MASETIACGGAAPSLSFQRSVVNLRHLPFHRYVSFEQSPSLRHLRLCTSAAKRSPKRLKYSAPRFTKGDGFLYVEVDPSSGIDYWKLERIVDLLKEGAVGVIPTDTVYAIVCDLKSHSAIERLRRIKEIETSKPLSILCHSFGDIDKYTMGFPRGNGQGQTNIFRAIKHCLPGPSTNCVLLCSTITTGWNPPFDGFHLADLICRYTFILPASKELPKQCTRYGTATVKCELRKNVGVRMPDDSICQAILEKMDTPLISTSVKWPKENEWMIDPVVIADIYEPEGLDFVVDGGIRVADPSTVVDMTRNPPTIIRQGKGPKPDWMVVKNDKDSATYEEEHLIPNAA